MRMPRRVFFFGLSVTALGALGACSSSSDEGGGGSGDSANARAGEIKGSDVWNDGTVLTGEVTIAKGADVELAPGAKITCAEGATLYVRGTLRARAKDSHARISCKTWKGVVISGGGKADLEGVELENGLIGIATASAAQDSRFTDGVISNSLKPFFVSEGSKLTVTNVKATTPEKTGPNELSQSDIEGVLIASRLDYEAYNSEGLAVLKQGELDLQDSTIHGKNGQDLVAARGGKRLKIAYTTLTGAHCGVHIEPMNNVLPAFEIDHVTSDSNIYGITIYGSAAAEHTVKASNFTGSAAWLDFQGDNGSISFDGVYTKGEQIITGGPPPKIQNAAAQPIANAKPR